MSIRLLMSSKFVFGAIFPVSRISTALISPARPLAPSRCPIFSLYSSYVKRTFQASIIPERVSCRGRFDGISISSSGPVGFYESSMLLREACFAISFPN